MEDLHITSQQGQPISFTPDQVKALTKAQVQEPLLPFVKHLSDAAIP